ncbi:uncharacterized protein LOC127162482 [Labeo rohita]|uniref:uncharacterized protein LOC127162482 n=1 Tax=Labeo rohita TaxID=84645 RepID=UPI0021E33A6E|nr:uncharacterized protein LOC127162482 [Labeo rohita]XP_050961216.1 uncharacterized protein LOC127162482 [Labeo rohita]
MAHLTSKRICRELLSINGNEYFILLPGKTFKSAEDIIKDVLEQLSGQQVFNAEKCDAILVFCFIVSRAGTDIDAALNGLNTLSESKPAVFMVLHHTFDPEKAVLDSSRYVTRKNTLTMDCFFNEDKGLLECVKNRDVDKRIRQWLQPQDTLEVLSDSKLVIVLLGMSGPEKTAAEHMILGREESQAETSPATQMKITVNAGEVDGEQVVVINTPDSFSSELSTEEIQQKIQFCINLISQKSYTLLLVIPVKQFKEKEREMEKKVMEVFRDRFHERLMILFTTTDEQNYNFKQLTQHKEIKFNFLNISETRNRSQVSGLLKTIEEIAAGKGKSSDNQGKSRCLLM